MIKTQFTLYLENRPGALFAVTRCLAEARINIDGLSVAACEDAGLAQIVTSDAEVTRALLNEAGIAYTTDDVVVLAVRNEPGALSRGLERLSKAGVNIDYIYGTVSDRSDCESGTIIISAPDLQAIEDTWDES